MYPTSEIYFPSSGGNRAIRFLTASGSDSGGLLLCGGGDITPARGAMIHLYGKQANAGNMYLDSCSGNFYFRRYDYTNLFTIDSGGTGVFSGYLYVNSGILQVNYPSVIQTNRNDQTSSHWGGLGSTSAIGGGAIYYGISAATYAGSIHMQLGNIGTGDFRVLHGNGTIVFRLEQNGRIRQDTFSGAEHFIFNAGDGGYKYIEFQRSSTVIGWLGNAGGLGGGGASVGDDFTLRAPRKLVLASDTNQIVAMPVWNSGNPGGSSELAGIASNGILFRTSSTRRSKFNIHPLTDWHSLLQLKPVTFEYLGTVGTPRCGFIAEDMAEIDSRFAGIYDGEPSTVRYHELTAPLVLAVQELHARIKALESRVN
jgi:hypothetical protein